MSGFARLAAAAAITAFGMFCAGSASSSSDVLRFPCSASHPSETFCGDGGPAKKARLLRPLSVTTNSSGGFFVADAGNEAVRAVSVSGTIATVAGIGTAGYSGDRGPAVAAELDGPADVARARDGSLLIADAGNDVIRRVSPRGAITTVAGIKAGTGRAPSPTPTAAVNVNLRSPQGVAALPDGGFLVADTGANLVLRVSAQGQLVIVAGTGVPGFSGDGRFATAARLNSPTRVLPTAGGGFLVLDIGNRIVRRVDPAGVISSVRGSTTDVNHDLFGQLEVNPGGLAQDSSGNLFVFDDRQVIKVSPTGTRTLVAGTGECGSNGDGGRATLATLATPVGLALDQSGGVLVADYNNAGDAGGNVRLVSPSGTISTVAGASNYAGCVGAGGAPTGSLWAFFYITAPRDARAHRAIRVEFITSRPVRVRTSLSQGSRRILSVLRAAGAGPNNVTFRNGVAAGQYKMEITATGDVPNNNVDEGGMLKISKRDSAALRVRR